MSWKYGFSFSLSRLLGISGLKHRVSTKINIPLTKQGRERKLGAFILNLFFKHFK